MEGTIHLQSKEGKEFEISKKAGCLSELIKGTIKDYSEDNIISLQEIDDKTTEKIIEYLNHFNGKSPPEIEKPLTSIELKNITDEWSTDFIDKLLLEDLINLTVASNFMGINSLLDLCCAKISCLCKDKNEEEIIKIFNITETFTEEEKEKIRKDNQWIEDNI